MNQWNKKRKLNSVNPIDNGGFSLIEVIIAMAILALISLPLINYFLDSLQQSARMAKRQRATITAQELTETIKSADFLIKENVGPGGVVTYTLENLPTGLTVTSIDDSDFDQGTGRGKYVVYGSNGQFDVEITVNADPALNNSDRYLISGIDSDTDLLLLERSQQDEALIYFLAANAEFCAQNPGQVLLSQDTIKNNMTRTIHVDVTKNPTDYTVQAYYIYSCAGLKGAGSAALTFQSSYLTNEKIADLSNIYLLYDCLANGSGGVKDDTVVLTVPGTGEAANLKLGIYLIAQNLTTATNSYTMQITGCNSSDINTRLYFYTNFRNSSHPSGIVDHLNNALGNPITTKPLTEQGKPLRVLVITTQVFEAGHVSGDAPLATMTSTKGE